MSEHVGNVTPLRRCRNYEQCRGDATEAPTRGITANLCPACAAAKIGERDATRNQHASVLIPAIRALMGPARRLEAAARALTDARKERHFAAVEFNSACRDLNELAQKVMNSDLTAAAKVEERLERERERQ